MSCTEQSNAILKEASVRISTNLTEILIATMLTFSILSSMELNFVPIRSNVTHFGPIKYRYSIISVLPLSEHEIFP
jgi:hypothetical protein